MRGVGEGLSDSSGVAMAFKFQQAEALLRGFNLQAQGADRAVAEIEALWMGEEFGRPDYPTPKHSQSWTCPRS